VLVIDYSNKKHKNLK